MKKANRIGIDLSDAVDATAYSMSRLSEKCRKCPNMKSCNNKRMEACAFIKIPNRLSNSYPAPLTSSLTTSMAKSYTPINIHMGDQDDINTSLEEVSKKISEEIYRKISIDCTFMRG